MKDLVTFRPGVCSICRNLPPAAILRVDQTKKKGSGAVIVRALDLLPYLLPCGPVGTGRAQVDHAQIAGQSTVAPANYSSAWADEQR